MKFSILLLLLILGGAYFGYTMHMSLEELKTENSQLSKQVSEQKSTIDSLKSTVSSQGSELQVSQNIQDSLARGIQKHEDDLIAFGKYFNEYDKELKKTLDNISKANQ